MKIAQIAPPWFKIPPTTYGGTESVIADLVEAQVAAGHDVTLFAPGDAETSAKLVSFIPRSLHDEGAPWEAHLKAYYHLSQSMEAAVAGHFDIIHTHLSDSSSLYVLPLTAVLTVPHVTTLHSHFPFDRVQERIGDADAYFLKRWAAAVPVVTISECASRMVPPELNVVGVVYNGLAINTNDLCSEQPGDYLAWLGRFFPEKGAHLAIEVAKRVGMPLVMAGTIDQASEESVRYFHEEIEPHIDQQQIRYVGPADKEQKNQLFRQAYGFLNPIEWEEPFGMVMIEAMVCGCPVISLAHGAAPELIVDGKTGFLVDHVDTMVEAIPRLATLDRHVICEHVLKNFGAQTMAERYVEVYQKIIDRSMYSKRSLKL